MRFDEVIFTEKKYEQHQLYINGESYNKRLVLKNVDLSFRGLEFLNLHLASLCDVDFTNSILDGANFSDANLACSNFTNASLFGVNLSGANLSGAILDGVDIRYAIGNSREVKTFQLPKYNIIITKTDMAIGCKQFSIEEWFSFDDEEIELLSIDALSYWNTYKDLIKSIIDFSF